MNITMTFYHINIFVNNCNKLIVATYQETNVYNINKCFIMVMVT